MALGQAAYGRVAEHLADRVQNIVLNQRFIGQRLADQCANSLIDLGRS